MPRAGLFTPSGASTFLEIFSHNILEPFLTHRPQKIPQHCCSYCFFFVETFANQFPTWFQIKNAALILIRPKWACLAYNISQKTISQKARKTFLRFSLRFHYYFMFSQWLEKLWLNWLWPFLQFLLKILSPTKNTNNFQQQYSKVWISSKIVDFCNFFTKQ